MSSMSDSVAVNDAATSSLSSSPPSSALGARAFVIEPIGPHTQTLVWLHGISDTKTNFKIIFDSMTLRGVRLVVPESPQLPVSIFGDRVTAAWFDVPTPMQRDTDPLAYEDDRVGILLVRACICSCLSFSIRCLSNACSRVDCMRRGWGFCAGGALGF